MFFSLSKHSNYNCSFGGFVPVVLTYQAENASYHIYIVSNYNLQQSQTDAISVRYP